MFDDTIAALASPPGAGARGILRLSGARSIELAARVLDRPLTRARACIEAAARVAHGSVECLVLVMPGPHSYTGEDVVELHLPAAGLLGELVLDQLRADDGVRDATPGEFTRRAFTRGRIDLAQAQAVLDLIHAADDAERRAALGVLSGGLAAGVAGVRGRVQDALALLEAGLDFADGETGGIDCAAWLPELRDAWRQLHALCVGVPEVAAAGDVVLVGVANAGKSSLCNALAGRNRSIVSARPGTTRDVLAVEIGGGARVLDAPGDLAAAEGSVDAQAVALRDRVAARSAGAVLVVDASAPVVPAAAMPVVAVALTKIDLAPADPSPPGLPNAPLFRVSSVTGAGIAALRGFLRGRGGGGASLRQRAAHELVLARTALERAIEAAVDGGEEMVAADLGAVLAALDRVSGRSSPEAVLDRVFGAFCLGK